MYWVPTNECRDRIFNDGGHKFGTGLEVFYASLYDKGSQSVLKSPDVFPVIVQPQRIPKMGPVTKRALHQ